MFARFALAPPGSRTLANSTQHANNNAYDALIYGVACHSLVTPWEVLKQQWWTAEKIAATVTEDYVLNNVSPLIREIIKIRSPFGDDELTDSVYLDWIVERLPRLFLALKSVHRCDKIRDAVDMALDDEDLPLSFDKIKALGLSSNAADNINEHFFTYQHEYLLREPKEHDHIHYGDNESVPLEYVHKVPPAAALQTWERVHLASSADPCYLRRQYLLRNPQGKSEKVRNAYTEREFKAMVMESREYESVHIAPIFASYVQKQKDSDKIIGYTMTPFLAEHTLGSFMLTRNPDQLLKKTKEQRTILMLEWMHCLAHTISDLHRRGLRHGSIVPSRILVNNEAEITFSDIGKAAWMPRDQLINPNEERSYKPPEEFPDMPVPAKAFNPTIFPDSPPESPLQSVFGSCPGQDTETLARLPDLLQGTRMQKALPPTPPDSQRSSAATNASFNSSGTNAKYLEEKADIFALGCVFTEILTFIVKGKLTDFVKHRESKNKKFMKQYPKEFSKSSLKKDASFHINVEEGVVGWVDEVIRPAAEAASDPATKSITMLVRMLHSMLARSPSMRPSASTVKHRIADVLLTHCGLDQLHCDEHQQSTLIRSTSVTTAGRPSVCALGSSDQPSISALISQHNKENAVASTLDPRYHITAASPTSIASENTIISPISNSPPTLLLSPTSISSFGSLTVSDSTLTSPASATSGSDMARTPSSANRRFGFWRSRSNTAESSSYSSTAVGSSSFSTSPPMNIAGTSVAVTTTDPTPTSSAPIASTTPPSSNYFPSTGPTHNSLPAPPMGAPPTSPLPVAPQFRSTPKHMPIVASSVSKSIPYQSTMAAAPPKPIPLSMPTSLPTTMSGALPAPPPLPMSMAKTTTTISGGTPADSTYAFDPKVAAMPLRARRIAASAALAAAEEERHGAQKAARMDKKLKELNKSGL